MRTRQQLIMAAAGSVLCAAGAFAEPFAFQGQLNDGGAPADGVYDLEFMLYGVNTGGTQIGSTVTLDDQQVSNGNFQVELDFGDGVFNGSARWIEIGVRDGDSSGGYTGLAPRLKVGSSPQASYANRAGVADSVANPQWSEAPGILFFGDGDEKVFINRDRVISPNDVLVVHSATTQLTGVNVSTWTNGMPYYAYSTGGYIDAYTYYDAVTDGWMVNKGGNDQFEIDQDNNVIITNDLIVGGSITSMDGGSGSTTGYKSFTPDSIYSGFAYDRVFNAFAGAIVAQGSTLYLRSDIDLPHGAMVTAIHIEYVDRVANNDLKFQLWKRQLTTLDYAVDNLATTSGSDPNMVQVLTITPDPAIEIDNTLYTYGLRVFTTSGTWPAAGNMGVRSIVIEYTKP